MERLSGGRLGPDELFKRGRKSHQAGEALLDRGRERNVQIEKSPVIVWAIAEIEHLGMLGGLYPCNTVGQLNGEPPPIEQVVRIPNRIVTSPPKKTRRISATSASRDRTGLSKRGHRAAQTPRVQWVAPT